MASRYSTTVAMAGILLGLSPAAQAAGTVYGDAPACTPDSGATAVRVTVDGFKDRDGNLRVIAYNAREDEYFVSGAYVNRIDTPMTKSGAMTVCVKLPGDGDYVIAALQDRDKNGKFGLRDGVGFVNNPKLPLGKPPMEDVTAPIRGQQSFDIVMNYLQGLSIRPIEGTQSSQPSRFERGGRR